MKVVTGPDSKGMTVSRRLPPFRPRPFKKEYPYAMDKQLPTGISFTLGHGSLFHRLRTHTPSMLPELLLARRPYRARWTLPR